MDNQALYNNCKRFCEISELESTEWTSPIRAEYQELLSKLQNGHSIVINNDRSATPEIDPEMVKTAVLETVSPPINQMHSEISDIAAFLSETIGYKNKGATF